MNDKKKYNEKFTLDMPFEEALERFAKSDQSESIDVQKESMPDTTIEDLIDAFEACSQKDEDGVEFWLARDLQKLFEYGEWRFFRNPVEKAIVACEESGHEPNHHFVQVHEMVQLGSGAERQVDNIRMSRYACYLTAMNCDPKKKPVAFAQTYFAIQTRRQEVEDKTEIIPMSEDEKRVFIRDQIKEHNKYLSSAAKSAGVVTPQEFAIFHSKGYQGLYGKTVPEIRKHKGLAKSANILDRMGSTELAANFFRVTQTEEKLRKEKIQGKNSAYNAHYEVGRQVRDAMLKISGIAPEDLPAVGGIKQAEKRLKAQSKVAELDEDDSRVGIATNTEPVDISKELWKYALLIMVQKPEMQISTANLILELPNYIAIPDGSEEPNASRGDSKFSQIVRNLKSHKASPSNFIAKGYAEDIPSGFKATQKGRDFVLANFGNRLGS